MHSVRTAPQRSSAARVSHAPSRHATRRHIHSKSQTKRSRPGASPRAAFSTSNKPPSNNNSGVTNAQASSHRSKLSPQDNEALHVVDPSVIFGSQNFMTKSETGLSVARYYTDVNMIKPRESWDYENYRIQYHSTANYDAYRKLGRGKYSEVFAGFKCNTEEPVVIKILKPVKKKKIRREVLALSQVLGSPYITQLIDVLKDPVTHTTCLVTSLSPGEEFKTLFPRLTDNDVRTYMYQLLTALDYAHSRGIIHRDVKPQNFIIDNENHVLRLIDWGLAEFYHPNAAFNVRVASRFFKGPELLLNMRDYDYSLDIWSFGATFAGLIYTVYPFFNGSDNVNMVEKIAQIVGSNAMYNYVDKYQMKVGKEEMAAIGNFPRKPFDLFVTATNQHLATPEAIDLLSKCLVVDHNERISAKEAMAHPYFDPIREQVEKQKEQLTQELQKQIEYRQQMDQRIPMPLVQGDSDQEN